MEEILDIFWLRRASHIAKGEICWGYGRGRRHYDHLLKNIHDNMITSFQESVKSFKQHEINRKAKTNPS